MAREIRTVTVLGAGDMGHGIAELAAIRGFEVRLRDVSEAQLAKAMEKVRWSLEKLVKHATLTRAAADLALARLVATTDAAAALAGTDLVIEAVPENLDLKRKVFAEAEAHAPAHAILASNTSTMRITEIGDKLADPSRVVGLHFFNPVLLMSLVEIIPGDVTTRETVASAEAFSRKLGKETVVLKRDSPGFITSRLVATWVGASIMALEYRIAPVATVDAAMKYKAGFPMGPFELADYTGLDVGFHASNYMAARLGPGYAPFKAMRERVERGDLGKKTGQGFYAWKDNRVVERVDAETAKGFEPKFILSIVANEAAKLLDEGVADAAEIDRAMRLGCAFPKGPLEWADAAGLDAVLATLEELHKSTAHPLTKPAEILKELVEEGNLGSKSGLGFHDHGPKTPAPSRGATPAYETVRVGLDLSTGVGTLTLDRPHRLHAINEKLLDDLSASLDVLDADDRIRVVLLTASGEKAFSAGADLSDGDLTPANAARLARKGHLVCLKIEKLSKPVVAALNGHALGGGLELALPADVRVAARRVKLALPEVTLGLLPAMGGTQRLPKLVGLARAKEIALLGDRFDAEEAHRLGLVARVFENETFEADARAFAADLATRAPLALRHAKQLLNMAPTTDVLAGMEAEAAAFGLLAGTEDALEGVSAMFQKRKPEFKGR